MHNPLIPIEVVIAREWREALRRAHVAVAARMAAMQAGEDFT